MARRLKDGSPVNGNGGRHINGIDSGGIETQRKRVVLQLVTSGASLSNLQQMLVGADPVENPEISRLTFSPGTVMRLHQAVLQELREAYTDDVARLKAAAVHRISADLVQMRAEPGPKWSAIRQHEELLSNILGTRAPIAIRFTGDEAVRAAFADIVGGMTSAELDAIARRQIAAERRRLLVEGSGEEVGDAAE